MTKKQPTPGGDSWDRAQLTIRLTQRRKERLMLLAGLERLSGGPGEAIDRALDLALSEQPEDVSERIAALEGAVRESEERRAHDAAAMAAELRKVAASLDALRGLLAELAQEE